MIDSLRRIIRKAPEVQPPAIPAGERVYAVGDVHGRLDLFEELINRIEADDATRPLAETTIVLLGDLVDRGPDSAGVIEEAMQLAERRRVRTILGNHEEMFLASFVRIEVLRNFLLHGGRETLLSYGYDPEEYMAATLEEVCDKLPDLVPHHHIDFLESLEHQVRIGDYLFVHAGIRPGVPLEEQAGSDLRWIRREFLEDRRDHGCVVVHGHTITDEVDEQDNRIGIDTGAFATGRLTAIGLEGTERWFLGTQPPSDPEEEAANAFAIRARRRKMWPRVAY